MAREKRLPRFRVQHCCLDGAAVCGWSDSGNYKSQGALPRTALCGRAGGVRGQWQRGTPRLRAWQLPAFGSASRGSLRAGNCLVPWAASGSWASSDLRLDSSLRAGWKKPLGVVPMDAILNCSPEDLEDYYNLLGCDELSTVEQILAEYKIKALECHPDKHPGNPKAVETFQKLQQAKETLANEERRARYDQWRRSRVTVPFQQWEALSSSVRTSMHWAVQSKKDQMLEAPDFGNTNNITKEMWTRETGDSGGGLLEGSKEQEDVAIPDVKPQSSKNPDSLRFSEGSYWHLHFRWSGDAPSDLLRKFRNYEI